MNPGNWRRAAVPLALVALLGAACAGGTAEGGGNESPEQFYRGKTVRFVVPYDPGGGYDTYARLIAPYLEEQLGATVVVQNQPGAGGLVAINQLAKDEPNGLTIAIMNGVGAGGAAIAGAEGVNFELDQLSYVGRVAASPVVFVAGAESRFRTLDDVRAAGGFRFGTSGVGASNYLGAKVLESILGLDAELVSGFPGSDEIELALIKGEVDGMTGSLESRIAAIESGDTRPLLVLGKEQVDQLPQTPAVLDQDLGPQETAIAQGYVNLLEIARPVVAPPGMDEERLAFLREALGAALEDPALVDEAKSQQRPIAYLPGEELDGLVGEVLGASSDFKNLLNEAYGTR